jgi:hypothetical protein
MAAPTLDERGRTTGLRAVILYQLPGFRTRMAGRRDGSGVFA